MHGVIYNIVIYIKISRRGRRFYAFISTFSRCYRMIFVPVDLEGQVSDFENINEIMRTNIIITCETKGNI